MGTITSSPSAEKEGLGSSDEADLSADSPEVTHVMYPFGPKGDPDDGGHYMRSLERRCDTPLAQYLGRSAFGLHCSA